MIKMEAGGKSGHGTELQKIFDKWNYIKIRNFDFSKRTSLRMKRSAKNICHTHEQQNPSIHCKKRNHSDRKISKSLEQDFDKRGNPNLLDPQ